MRLFVIIGVFRASDWKRLAILKIPINLNGISSIYNVDIISMALQSLLIYTTC